MRAPGAGTFSGGFKGVLAGPFGCFGCRGLGRFPHGIHQG